MALPANCHPSHLHQLTCLDFKAGSSLLYPLLPLKSWLWLPSPLRNCYSNKEEWCRNLPLNTWCTSSLHHTPQTSLYNYKCMVRDKPSKDFCWRYANFRETWFKYMKTTQGSLESTHWLGTPWKGHGNFPRTAENSFFAPVRVSPQVWLRILQASHNQKQNMCISKFGHVLTVWKRPCLFPWDC